MLLIICQVQWTIERSSTGGGHGFSLKFLHLCVRLTRGLLEYKIHTKHCLHIIYLLTISNSGHTVHDRRRILSFLSYFLKVVSTKCFVLNIFENVWLPCLAEAYIHIIKWYFYTFCILHKNSAYDIKYKYFAHKSRFSLISSYWNFKRRLLFTFNNTMNKIYIIYTRSFIV